MEIWKDVPNYEGRYKVSSLGRVKSILKTKEKVLNGSISNKGYVQYSLNYKEKNLYNVYGGHQLVAMAFLGHIPNGTHTFVVDHIDDDKTNNTVGNLRLVSNRENSTKYGSSSKYFGVNKDKDRWAARLWWNGTNLHLGVFDNEIDAHLKVVSFMEENNIKRNIQKQMK